MADFWARMGGVTISDAMVLLETKVGEGRALLEAMARKKAAAALAWERGIAVSERAVEAALRRFYDERGLTGVEAAREWRARHHLKEDAVRSYMREQMLIEAIKNQIVTDAAIEERFRAQARDFRRLDLEEFPFPSEEAARTFIQAVEAGEMEARLGERKRVAESRLPSDVAEAIARADQGTLVGPFLSVQRTHLVYRLVRLIEPCLDEPIRESLREQIFREAMEPLTFLL